MIWRGLWVGLVLAVAGSAAAADAPAQSARPVARPAALAGVPVLPVLNPDNPAQGAAIPFMAAAAATLPNPEVAEAGLTRSLVPRARPAIRASATGAAAPAAAKPDVAKAADPAPAVPAVALASTSAAAISPLPRARKGLFGFLKAGAARTQPDTGAITGRAGSVCGVPGIKGKELPPIVARVKGCGVADPVQVTSIDGVALTEAAIMDCPTAKALNAWVTGAVKPAFGNKGGGVEAMRVAAHYICRTRNNRPGARISEHGKGKAIDISGILLASGAEITVAGDYRRGSYSKAMKSIHRAACGPFGTTLGPGSDGVHEDHIHLDTAAYRSGPYCK